MKLAREGRMDEAQREFIRQVLDKGNDLTLATIRPDG